MVRIKNSPMLGLTRKAVRLTTMPFEFGTLARGSSHKWWQGSHLLELLFKGTNRRLVSFYFKKRLSPRNENDENEMHRHRTKLRYNSTSQLQSLARLIAANAKLTTTDNASTCNSWSMSVPLWSNAGKTLSVSFQSPCETDSKTRLSQRGGTLGLLMACFRLALTGR